MSRDIWCIKIAGNKDLKINLLAGYYATLKYAHEQEIMKS